MKKALDQGKAEVQSRKRKAINELGYICRVYVSCKRMESFVIRVLDNVHEPLEKYVELFHISDACSLVKRSSISGMAR